MSEPQVLQNPVKGIVASYLLQRRGIGIIGVLLPFVISIGHALVIGHATLLGSVSAYYYTNMRNIFVGSMAAIGVFLISYRYDRLDNILSNIAGVGAIGVALFPTQPDHPTHKEQIIGYLHAASAAVLFVLLAVFCFVLFTRTDPTQPMTSRKRARNAIYRVCGAVIVLAMVFLGLTLTPLFSDAWVNQNHPRFWAEAIMIFSFGVSWLVKGETILKD